MPDNVLNNGEVIQPGGALVSPNGRYRFGLTGEGELSLWDTTTSAPVWKAGIGNPFADSRMVILLPDGSLRVYNPGEDQLAWTSDSARPGEDAKTARLELRDDGRAYIVTSKGDVYWSTDRTTTYYPDLTITAGQTYMMSPADLAARGLTYQSSNNWDYILLTGSTAGSMDKPAGVPVRLHQMTHGYKIEMLKSNHANHNWFYAATNGVYLGTSTEAHQWTFARQSGRDFLVRPVSRRNNAVGDGAGFYADPIQQANYLDYRRSGTAWLHVYENNPAAWRLTPCT
ncbi:hypothetical protein [Streptomyces sp. WAC07061]|uniref:hypothetical protein n=1 Tax=Streptomyces sp. WAC07061 TaxID=2487410 RepID=UPI00163BDF22|nr:hypothetical protein [Streptomyces sp. WAC07061]